MEVILKQDIRNLGDKDEVVRVKDGYARNYLIPRSLAIMATASNRKIVQENSRQAEHKQEHIRQEAGKIAEKLGEEKLTIETLASVEGKIFGSVTALQIANKLKEKGYEVDRRRISFDADIKETGTYTAIVNLHKDVKVNVSIEVVAKEKK